MNYWLMINDYPPLIIYDDDRSVYYKALQDYDEREELEPFKEFLIYEMNKTWEKALAKATGKETKRKPLESILEEGKAED